LNKLGCNVVALNANLDETKISISYEAFEAALRRLQRITEALGTTLGVRIDVGGECIFVVDNMGRNISRIDLGAAMAELALSANPGKTIAIYANQPYIFEEIAARHGGSVIRTKVDPQSLMIASLEKNVALAGDGQGNFIFPDFQPSIDGLMAIAKLLEFLALQKRNLSEVIANLPPYYMTHSKVSCLWEAKGGVMRQLSQRFEGQLVNSVEGVKIVFGDHEWVLIIPSQDQPHISIVVEALSQADADSLLAKYTQLIESLQPQTT